MTRLKYDINELKEKISKMTKEELEHNLYVARVTNYAHCENIMDMEEDEKNAIAKIQARLEEIKDLDCSDYFKLHKIEELNKVLKWLGEE